MLAVDVLSKIIKHAIDTGILQQLHPRRPVPAVSLYADDVVLFCHPSEGDVIAVKEILHLFGMVSGLQVNYAKSSASLLCCSDEDAAPVTEHLACPIVGLPITYLGILLHTRRPQPRSYSPSSIGLQDACPLGRPS